MSPAHGQRPTGHRVAHIAVSTIVVSICGGGMVASGTTLFPSSLHFIHFQLP